MSQVSLAPDGQKKGSRIWTDGCFDILLLHHSIVLQQAKEYGKRLIVGIHSDDEIEEHKISGFPIFQEEDRYRLINALKWVDEVVEDAPYVTTVSTLNQFDCDFCIIPDATLFTEDINTNYSEIKKSNRYKTLKVKDNITENEIVGRIFLLDNTHHLQSENIGDHVDVIRTFASSNSTINPTRITTINSLPILEERNIGSNKKIVYVCGSFDIFHVGHLSFLESAKELGDYLIVGVYSDYVINQKKGSNFPIQNLVERAMTLSSLKIVDEIVIGAPKEPELTFFDQLRVHIVAATSSNKQHYNSAVERGIFVTIEIDSDMTTNAVINKIINRKLESYHTSIIDGEIASYNNVPRNNQQ